MRCPPPCQSPRPAPAGGVGQWRGSPGHSQKDRGRFRRKEGGVTPPPALTAETATENVAEKPRLRGNGVCSPSPRLPSLGARFLCRRLRRRFLRRVFSKPLPPPPPAPPPHKAAGVVPAESHRQGTAKYNAPGPRLFLPTRRAALPTSSEESRPGFSRIERFPVIHWPVFKPTLSLSWKEGVENT